MPSINTRQLSESDLAHLGPHVQPVVEGDRVNDDFAGGRKVEEIPVIFAPTWGPEPPPRSCPRGLPSSSPSSPGWGSFSGSFHPRPPARGDTRRRPCCCRSLRGSWGPRGPIRPPDAASRSARQSRWPGEAAVHKSFVCLFEFEF